MTLVNRATEDKVVCADEHHRTANAMKARNDALHRQVPVPLSVESILKAVARRRRARPLRFHHSCDRVHLDQISAPDDALGLQAEGLLEVVVAGVRGWGVRCPPHRSQAQHIRPSAFSAQ